MDVETSSIFFNDNLQGYYLITVFLNAFQKKFIFFKFIRLHYLIVQYFQFRVATLQLITQVQLLSYIKISSFTQSSRQNSEHTGIGMQIALDLFFIIFVSIISN